MFSLLKRTLPMLAMAAFAGTSVSAHNQESTEELYWIKVAAKDKYERTAIANSGVSIETIADDYVIVLGSKKELKQLQTNFNVVTSFVDPSDFPSYDSEFHNYQEMIDEMQRLANENADIVKLGSMGKSLEGRDQLMLTITAATNELGTAGMLLMGGHHAREHLSMEMPLMLAQKLVAEYRTGNERIRNLVSNRVIYIVPMVNPDGAEYDIATGNYRSWRKNRRNNGGTYGVDLNRNYSYKWGQEGASNNPSSDTFRGPTPFSEPETQNVRDFVNSHTNLTTVLSLHTFSKLILYPWGYTYDKISNEKDLEVHETMANRMSQWNGYTAQTGSDLYLVSGEMGDWIYGEKKLVTFTFELDPGSMFEGGFYPGQKMIQPVFNKNYEPFLYLMEYSDNPYRVLNAKHTEYGLSSPLIQ